MFCRAFTRKPETCQNTFWRKAYISSGKKNNLTWFGNKSLSLPRRLLLLCVYARFFAALPYVFVLDYTAVFDLPRHAPSHRRYDFEPPSDKLFPSTRGRCYTSETCREALRMQGGHGGSCLWRDVPGAQARCLQTALRPGKHLPEAAKTQTGSQACRRCSLAFADH